MSFADFEASVARDTVAPAGLSPALRALWYDGRGNWDKAHTCVQDPESSEEAWVHAYLHRKEGDQANAAYWYSRAGKPVVRPGVLIEAEWAQIARALLGGE